MILEHAVLPVRPGLEAEFEATLRSARDLIAAMPGFRNLTVSRGIEHPSSYLLLVAWDSLEAHERGFRGSAQYLEWKRLLHRFYDPFPVVEHFVPICPEMDPLDLLLPVPGDDPRQTQPTDQAVPTRPHQE